MHRLAIALTLAATAAWGQAGPQLREVTHARPLAMGGAYRAIGLGGEAVTGGNPATLALYKRYLLEATGGYDPVSRYGFADATITDSVTTSLAAGVSYQFHSLGLDPAKTLTHSATLALALPVSDRVMVGVSGRYLNSNGFQTANGITVDTGIVVRATEGFTIGLSGHNLVDINTTVVNRAGVLGFGFVGTSFSLAADIQADFLPNTTTPLFAFRGGAEYIAGDAVPLRLGYAYDNVTRSQFLSAGLGYVAAGSGVDVAYRHEFGGNLGRWVVVTLKLQVE
jgi:hypothetical protein